MIRKNNKNKSIQILKFLKKQLFCYDVVKVAILNFQNDRISIFTDKLSLPMKIGFYILSCLCFLLISSCDEDKTSTKVVKTENNEQTPIITAKAIENFKYTDYALSPESETALANWEKYQELAIQISYLKKTDLSFFNSDKAELKKFIIELKASTPKEFLTNPIISRTLIVETALLRLNQNLSLDHIDDQSKLQSIKDVLIAFSNLNYHINKKLERDLYDQIQPEE